jgi:LacI family transcriptional regulator
LVLEDREVAEALERIRRRGPTGLRVAELASELAISQSTLQRRFRRLLGRTIKDEILRVQIERVKQLLAHSDLRLEQVASQCGFSSGHYLSEVFHKREGLTPRAYRNLARPTRGP